jgi:hypothetical protein
MENSAESIAKLIRALPSSNARSAALAFLEDPRVAPVAMHVAQGSLPAHECLSTWTLRQKSTSNANILTYGFPSFIAALKGLPRDELLAMTAFDGPEFTGIFWLARSGRLIGFVLVQKRDAASEAERLAWFRRHLTSDP